MYNPHRMRHPSSLKPIKTQKCAENVDFFSLSSSLLSFMIEKTTQPMQVKNNKKEIKIKNPPTAEI